MTLQEIADQLGCRVIGDSSITITGVAGMEHAGPGHLTFLANPKYAPKVKHTKAGAILLFEEIPGLEIPCLVSAKSDAQVLCVDPTLARYPNTSLLTGVLVTRVVTSPSGGRVRSCTFFARIPLRDRSRRVCWSDAPCASP